MKKTLLALTLLLTSTIALAQGWWSLGGDVQVTNTLVTFSAYNSTGRAIYCQGYVYGQTNFGEVANFYVDGWVPSGSTVNGYVETWGNRYLVNGWAEINCRF